MKIFSFFKKQKRQASELTPSTILKRTLEYIPDFYRESRRYLDSQEFFEQREFGLSLDSLIEMADESGHYFSERFWLDLATCAEKMEIKTTADYCRQQILRNEGELKHKTPYGWTTNKISETVREHHIAQVLKNDRTADRHKKDKLSEMLKSNGFHLKPFGRGGTIYYIENGRVLEIGIEMSGSPEFDMLVYFYSASGWTIPQSEPIDNHKQAQIRQKLLEWLVAKRIRADVG